MTRKATMVHTRLKLIMHWSLMEPFDSRDTTSVKPTVRLQPKDQKARRESRKPACVIMTISFLNSLNILHLLNHFKMPSKFPVAFLPRAIPA